jgi:hypothetical protein
MAPFDFSSGLRITKVRVFPGRHFPHAAWTGILVGWWCVTRKKGRLATRYFVYRLTGSATKAFPIADADAPLAETAGVWAKAKVVFEEPS